MILTIGGTKGGSGKTTIATNLAQIRSKEGYKVLLIDADEQQSTWNWSVQRDHIGLGFQKLGYDSLPFVTVCMTGRAIYANVIKMEADYDDIIIDTGGRDTASQRTALCASDKFLIPFKPSSIDIWTIGSLVRLISDCINDKLKTYAVISQADSTGKDNIEAIKVIRGYEQITCLDCHIGNRKAFRNAAGEGLGVFELNPRDEKACKEIKDLYNRLYT